MIAAVRCRCVGNAIFMPAWPGAFCPTQPPDYCFIYCEAFDCYTNVYGDDGFCDAGFKILIQRKYGGHETGSILSIIGIINL